MKCRGRTKNRRRTPRTRTSARSAPAGQEKALGETDSAFLSVGSLAQDLTSCGGLDTMVGGPRIRAGHDFDIKLRTDGQQNTDRCPLILSARAGMIRLE